MVANSKIEWTTHTFNPVWGCVRVSPGCEHCYAETFAKRVGQAVWGPASTTQRRTFGAAHWAEPRKWNAAAAAAGQRARVFCASMADVFEDHPQVAEAREQLWPLIDETPDLDWLLLTKRPENIRRFLRTIYYADAFYQWRPNVWLGTTVESQEYAPRRIPLLLNTACQVRFLSIEPQLGPVDVSLWLRSGEYFAEDRINWVIVGGESGAGARPFNPDWARSLIEQCRTAGVPCFVKQLGSKPIGLKLSGKGDNWDEWPADVRVREFPAPTVAEAWGLHR